MAAVATPARRRLGGKKRRAWQAALLATSLCACLAARRWGGGEGPPGSRGRKEGARAGNTATNAAGPGMAAGRGSRRTGAGRKRGGGGVSAAALPPPGKQGGVGIGANGASGDSERFHGRRSSEPLAEPGREEAKEGYSMEEGSPAPKTKESRAGGDTTTRSAIAVTSSDLLRTAASRRGSTSTRHSGSSTATTPESTALDATAATAGSSSSPPPGKPPSGAAAAAAAAPVIEREDMSSSSGGVVGRALRDGSPENVDVDATAAVVGTAGGGDPAVLPFPSTAAARRRSTAALPRASSWGYPSENAKGYTATPKRISDRNPKMMQGEEGGEEAVGGEARKRLRRRRRLQSSSGSQPPSSVGREEEEEEEAVVHDQDEDEDEGAFGSVGLLAFLVCFGLLFCVMEAAKCYFLVECRRRQRWRRQRAQGHMHEGQMPIASSRVVAPEVPVAGAKDGWVEVVVHEVSMSAEKPEGGAAVIPSATGYAVAGASHALQEAIEHARRLSPGRGYRAVFTSPARPEQQQQHHLQEEEEEEEVGVSLEMSGMSPSPDLSEVQPRSATPAPPPAATAAGAAAGGMAPWTPAY